MLDDVPRGKAPKKRHRVCRRTAERSGRGSGGHYRERNAPVASVSQMFHRANTGFDLLSHAYDAANNFVSVDAAQYRRQQ